MNAPDRYERFVVPEGTKKVSYERDTKIINAATFAMEREEHTIGNILRMQCFSFIIFLMIRQLHRDPNVLFTGYKLPHATVQNSCQGQHQYLLYSAGY